MTSAPLPRSGTIPILNALRGLSALYVAAYHSVDMLTPNGDRLTHVHEPFRALIHGNPFGFGRYAVIVFFVLSGFVIHLRQAQRPDESRGGSWLGSYAWRRAMRIYPPLIFALALTYLLAVVGERINPNFYGHPLPDHDGWRIAMNDNLGPLEFVMNILPGGYTYGTNAPLWSVRYEVCFYAAYATLLLIAFDKLRLPVWPTISVLIGIGLATGIIYEFAGSPGNIAGLALSYPMFVVMYFSVWLIGLGLAELYAQGAVLRHRRTVAAIALAALGGLSYWADNRGHIPGDFLWGLAIAALMAVAVLRPAHDYRTEQKWISAIGRSADWSYSLYLVHFPVIVFVRAVWVRDHALPHNGLLGTAGFCIAVAAGIGAWALIERPTMQLVRRPPIWFDRRVVRQVA